MEGEGGGGGSGDGAGTSGDSGGEQLLTVKHELRTGERPRPLPAGPAAEARLGAAGSRAQAKGARTGGTGPGRGFVDRSELGGPRRALGRGRIVCSRWAPNIGPGLERCLHVSLHV